MGTQTIAVLTAENKIFYDKTLLSRAKPAMHLYEDAQKKRLMKKNGTTMNFRKFNALKVPENALSEGVTPSGSDLSMVTVQATVKQYGDFVTTSDLLDMAGIDPVITDTSENLGDQAALTYDTVIRDEILKTTNVFYANGKVSKTALTKEDVANDKDIKKMVRTLRNSNAKVFSDGYYHAIIAPSQSFDLMSSPFWMDVSKYANTTQLLKGELGKMHGVRFKETTNTAIEEVGSGDTLVEVHKALVYGKDAYGVIELENAGGKPEIIVKELGSAGTDDPLDQRASIGWKSAFTAALLQTENIIRYETAVSE